MSKAAAAIKQNAAKKLKIPSYMIMTPGKRYKLTPYFFILPALIYFCIVTFIPAAIALPISLTNWKITTTNIRFLGLRNYEMLFQDSMFGLTMLNTLWFFFYIPLSLAFGLLIALLLNTKIKFNTFFRVTFYAPVVTSTIAAAIIFEWLYDPTFGLLNQVLKMAGIPGLNWVKSPDTAIMSVIIFKIWKDCGNVMIIYLAGLQDIPAELYESASIDGSNGFKDFIYITLPMLKPQHIYLLMTKFIGLFMIFQETYILRGPMDSTTTIVNYIYTEGFKNMRMGYACSMSMILFVIILTLTIIQSKVLKLKKL